MAVQDNQIKAAINEYFFKNRADFEAHKDEILNNSKFYIEDDGLGVVTMQTKTLWTNPSPTSAMSPQTLTLDESMKNYDYVILKYRFNISDCTNDSIFIFSIKNIDYSSQNVNFFDLKFSTNGQRRYYIVSDNQIRFDIAEYSNTSILNTILLPYQFIGIKLVNSQAEITNVYSTDETVVGRWIDGKKIYRKVLTGTINNSVSKELIFDSNMNNASNYGIITINETMSFFIPSSGNTLYTPINFANPNNYIRANIQKGGDNNNIFVYVAAPSNITGTIYATLEYTKTTD